MNTEDIRNVQAAEALGITPETAETTSTTEPNTLGIRPAKILGKFESQADLEKAYKELETKLGKPKEQGSNESTEEGEGSEEPTNELPSDELDADAVDETEDESEQASDVPAEQIAAREGVQNAFQALSTAGEMTPEVQAEFDKVGISKELVAEFKALVDFRASTQERELKSIAGTDAQYKELLDWASNKLSDADIDAFDKAINQGTFAESKVAVTNLVSRMKTEGGIRQDNLVKSTGNSRSKGGYESMAQLVKDQNDSRYSKDPAFRQKVLEKLERSNI